MQNVNQNDITAFLTTVKINNITDVSLSQNRCIAARKFYLVSEWGVARHGVENSWTLSVKTYGRCCSPLLSSVVPWVLSSCVYNCLYIAVSNCVVSCHISYRQTFDTHLWFADMEIKNIFKNWRNHYHGLIVHILLVHEYIYQDDGWRLFGWWRFLESPGLCHRSSGGTDSASEGWSAHWWSDVEARRRFR